MIVARGAVALIAVLAGCADDSLILPAGSPVPSVYDFPVHARRILHGDGIPEEHVFPVSAFLDGRPVRYWDLGPAPDHPMPFYVLCRRIGTHCEPVEHPPVVDLMPGEEGYSPFGQVIWVPVTGRWRGQILSSVLAIDEAVDRGLVEEPEPRRVYANCPMVSEGTVLHPGPEPTNMVLPSPVYVRGKLAGCIDFRATYGLRPLLELGTRMIVHDLYRLDRMDGYVLSEVELREDLTGDDDFVDSNDIFDLGMDALDASPLTREVDVTVPPDYGSIDTSGDDTLADYRAVSDMFDIDAPELTPLPGRVMGVQVTERLLNRPLQASATGL